MSNIETDLGAFRENWRKLVQGVFEGKRRGYATLPGSFLTLNVADTNPRSAVDKIKSWCDWFQESPPPPQEHVDFFYRYGIQLMVNAVLKRRYATEEHANYANSLVLWVLPKVASFIDRDIPELYTILVDIFNEDNLMYLKYGRGPEDDEELDDLWFQFANDGDPIDYFDGKEWTPATIIAFREEKAEMIISVDGQKLVKVDSRSPLVAPRGDGPACAARLQAKEAKDAKWRAGLKAGDVIDALDTVNKWYQAMVVETRLYEGNDFLKVTFVGWPSKYDEWLLRSSPRIAPINSKSRGKRGNNATHLPRFDQELVVHNTSQDPDGFAVRRKELQQSAYFLHNLNMWGESGGFDSTLARLSNTDPMSFQAMLHLTTAYASFSAWLAQPYASRFIPMFAKGISWHLQHQKEEMLRHLSRDVVMGILGNLRRIIRRVTTQSDTGRFVENLHLNLGMTCLKSSMLTQRLNGLVMLTDLFRMAHNSQLYPLGFRATQHWADGHCYETYEILPLTSHTTPQLMNEYFTSNALTDVIFGDTAHAEVVKRSAELLQFVASHSGLTEDDIAKIWNCVNSPHQDMSSAALSMLEKLVFSVDSKLLVRVLKLVQGISPPDHTLETISLLGSISRCGQPTPEAAEEYSKLVEKARSEGNTPPTIPEGWERVSSVALTYLWDLIDKSAPGSGEGLKEEVLHKAMDYLEQSLAVPHTSERLSDYFSRCVQSLKSKASPTAAIRALRGLLYMLPPAELQSPSHLPTRPSIIQSLATEQDIIQLLLEEYQAFKASARPQLEALKSEGPSASQAAQSQPKSSEKVQAAINEARVGWGALPYLSQIRLRLDFMAFMLEHSEASLTSKQADALWESSTEDIMTPDEQRLGLEWFKAAVRSLIDREKESRVHQEPSGRMIGFRLGPDDAEHLFLQEMSRSTFVKHISTSSLGTWAEYFDYINSRVRKLVLSGDDAAAGRTKGSEESTSPDAEAKEETGPAPPAVRQYMVVDFNLLGISTLWEMILLGEKDAGVQSAIQFLTSLPERLAPQVRPKLKQFRQLVLDQCIQRIELSLLDAKSSEITMDDASHRICRCLEVLGFMLNRSVESMTAPPHSFVHGERFPINAGFWSKHRGKSKLVRFKMYAFKEERGLELKHTLAAMMDVAPQRVQLLNPSKSELKGHLLGRTLAELGVKPETTVTVSVQSEESTAMQEADATVVQEELPASIIVSNEKYFGTLMNLLGGAAGDDGDDLSMPAVERAAWRVLSRLPTNPAIESEIRNIKGAVGWEKLLNAHSTTRLLYSLQIIRRLLLDPSIEISAAQNRLKARFIEGHAPPGVAKWNKPPEGEQPHIPVIGTRIAALSPEEREKEAQFRSDWRLSFVRTGGVLHILRLLLDPAGVLGSSAHVQPQQSTPPVLARASSWVSIDEGQLDEVGDSAMEAALEILNFYALACGGASSPRVLQSTRSFSDVLSAEGDKNSRTAGVPEWVCRDNSVQDGHEVLDSEILRPQLTNEDVDAVLQEMLQSKAFVFRLLELMLYAAVTNVSYAKAGIVRNAGYLWQTLTVLAPDMWEYFLSAPKPIPAPAGFIRRLLLAGTCGSESSSSEGASRTLRRAFARASYLLCLHTEVGKGVDPPHSIFLSAVLNHTPRSDKLNEASTCTEADVCEEFFALASMLVPIAYQREASDKFSRFSAQVKDLVQRITERKVVELRGGKQEDVALRGMLQLLGQFVKHDARLEEEISSSNGTDLIAFVFKTCLFDLPQLENEKSKREAEEEKSKEGKGEGPAGETGSHALGKCLQDAPPLCKQSATRSPAYSLLNALEDVSDAKAHQLHSLLAEQLPALEVEKSWKYDPKGAEKSPVGYVGLVNLGCVCYMNSLMQQLFMIPRLRYGILQAKCQSDHPKRSALRTDSILYQLKTMFAYLESSERVAYNPSGWAFCFKDENGKPTNWYTQQDAHEYFDLLCDRLEHALKPTEEKTLLNAVFMGSLTSELLALPENSSLSQVKEQFYCVSVEVKNKKNLVESLETLVEGDIISGYKVEGSDKEIDVRKRMSFNRLSNVLLLHLKVGLSTLLIL